MDYIVRIRRIGSTLRADIVDQRDTENQMANYVTAGNLKTLGRAVVRRIEDRERQLRSIPAVLPKN